MYIKFVPNFNIAGGGSGDKLPLPWHELQIASDYYVQLQSGDMRRFISETISFKYLELIRSGWQPN